MKPPPGSVRFCRLFFPALAAALLLSLATGASLATGPPAGSASAATDNAAGAAAPAADNGWVDRTHSRVERDLFDTVAWFDRFFGDDRMVVTERPESFLRWMNALRWDEEERFSFRSTVRASLRLPRLKKRWRLVVSGETQGDPNAVTQEDPGNPGMDVGDGALPPPQAFPEKRDHLRRGRLGLDPARVDRTELPGTCPVPPERLPEMALPRRGARPPLAEEGRREPEAGVGRDAAGGDPVHRGGTESAGRWGERALTPKIHVGERRAGSMETAGAPWRAHK